MKHLIILSFLLFTSLNVTAANSNVFSLNIQGGDNYHTGITAIREYLGTEVGNTLIQDRLVTTYRMDENSDNTPIVINFETDNQNYPIRLVLRRDNLYVAGFILGQTFFIFDGETVPTPTFEDGTVVNNRVRMNVRGDYTQLGRRANHTLEGLTINPQNIATALETLARVQTGNIQQNQALALFRLIIFTAEAIRFNAVEENIRRTLDDHNPMQIAGALPGLIRNWAALGRGRTVTIPNTRLGRINRTEEGNPNQLTRTYIMAVGLEYCGGASSSSKRSVKNEMCDPISSVEVPFPLTPDFIVPKGYVSAGFTNFAVIKYLFGN